MQRSIFLISAILLSVSAIQCASQTDRSWVPASLSGSKADSFALVASELSNPCTETDSAQYDSLKSLLQAGKTCREAVILTSDITFYLSHDVPESRTLGIVKTEAQNLKSPHTFHLENRPRLGDPAAPAEIVVFSDFQCPYCAVAAETLHKVYDARPESVSVVFKNMPLQNIHPYAAPAALVAAYAHKQGRFWEVHDRLFASQDKLDTDFITEIVESLGTTVDDLFDAQTGLSYSTTVIEDIKEASAAGVQGTPTIFINGVEIANGLRYDRLIARVDAEIQAPQSDTARSKTVACPYPGLESEYNSLTAPQRAQLRMHTAGSLCPCPDSTRSLHECAAQNTCPAAPKLVRRIIEGITGDVPNDAILLEIDSFVQKERSASN